MSVRLVDSRNLGASVQKNVVAALNSMGAQPQGCYGATAPVPALALDFLTQSLDPRITFSRADTAPAATRVNSAGLIEVATGAEQITQVALNTQGTWSVTQPTSGVVSFSTAGVRINSADGTYCGVTQVGVQPVIGKVYKYSINILSVTSGSVAVALGGAQTGSISATGVTEGYLTAASTAAFELKRNGICDVTVVSLSIKLVTDAPRFDYDPVTLAPRGLLIEEARTNNEQNSTADNVMNGTASTDGTLGPDGVAASKFTADSVTAAHFVYKASYTPAITTAYAVSVYLKAGTSSVLQVTTSGNFNSGLAALNVDLVAGTFALVGTGGSSGFLTSAGGGWYRAGFVLTTTAAAAGAVVIVGLANNLADNRLPNVVTNGTQTFYHACRQFESVGATGATTFPTSYIPTTTAAVTRAADVASMTGTNFSSWFNASEGTFVCGFDLTPYQTTYPRVWSVGDTNYQNAIECYGDNTKPVSSITVANVIQSNYTGGLYSATPNYSYRNAFAYKTNDTNSAYNGVVGTVDTACSLPAFTSGLTIGKALAAGSAYLNGHIQRISYFNKRLPNATLKALSA